MAKAKHLRRSRERAAKSSFFRSRRKDELNSAIRIPVSIQTTQDVDDTIGYLINRNEIRNQALINNIKSHIHNKVARLYFIERLRSIYADNKIKNEFLNEKKDNRGLTVIPKVIPVIKQKQEKENIYEEHEYGLSDW